MQTATEQVRVGCKTEVEQTEVIVDDAEVAELQSRMASILDLAPDAQGPQFYLSTISRSSWVPRIIAVRHREELIGALYLKERKVGALGTGIIYGDGTLCSIVAAKSEDRGSVLCAGIDSLLRRRNVVALRILVPPSCIEFDMLRRLADRNNVDYSTVPIRYHFSLSLEPSYEEFLDKLGKRLRRNMRYYRRKSEDDRHRYVENIKLAEFASGAEMLLRQGVIGASRDGLKRAMKMFACARHPILVGLRDQNGMWLSLLGGWMQGTQPVIFLQINSDKMHSKSSLSLVMRGHFFESLIRRRFCSVLFWAGVGEPFLSHCQAVPTESVYLDKRGPVWSSVRRLVAASVQRLPRSLALNAEWIVPNGALNLK